MQRSAKIIAGLAGAALLSVLAGAGARGQPTNPTDSAAVITRLTVGLLERSQLAHKTFDEKLAGKVIERYMDALDASRTLFLASDVEEFVRDSGTVASSTRTRGDTRIANAIFQRYLQRLEQRVAAEHSLLKTASFDFTGDDAYSTDREDAARPEDLRAARQLWGRQLRAAFLQEKLGGRPVGEISTILDGRHVRELQTMKALRSQDVLEIYLDTLAHVYDPHSDYLGGEESQSLSIAMNLALFGIGATLESEDGVCTIRELVPGGPAARSGVLAPGDRILAVTQPGQPPADVVNLPLSRTVELIRGPKGTTVTLSIASAGAPDGAPPRLVSLMRDKIRLQDHEAKARLVDLPTPGGGTLRLGIIDLPSFYSGSDRSTSTTERGATADVTRLLGKLKQQAVQGLVLDLRHNGGGSLEEAISLTGLFLQTGPVVQTLGADGRIQVGADEDSTVAYDGPLVVLVSRFTASASEILAGALQDYGRALVVGDTSTFGKGTVQTVFPLGPVMQRMGLAPATDPGALKLTIAKFYRPSGASTQLRGVASDIVLPSPSDAVQISEKTMKNPLPWDTVAPLPYRTLNRVTGYLASLRAESARRVSTTPALACVAVELAQMRRNLTEKTLSLNETTRRQELAREEARRQRCDKQEEVRQRAAAPAVYELTVAGALRAGLPTPRHSLQQPSPATASARPADANAARDRVAAERFRAADAVVLRESLDILADYAALLRPQTTGGDLKSAVRSQPDSDVMRRKGA